MVALILQVPADDAVIVAVADEFERAQLLAVPPEEMA